VDGGDEGGYWGREDRGLRGRERPFVGVGEGGEAGIALALLDYAEGISKKQYKGKVKWKWVEMKADTATYQARRCSR